MITVNIGYRGKYWFGVTTTAAIYPTCCRNSCIDTIEYFNSAHNLCKAMKLSDFEILLNVEMKKIKKINNPFWYEIHYITSV